MLKVLPCFRLSSVFVELTLAQRVASTICSSQLQVVSVVLSLTYKLFSQLMDLAMTVKTLKKQLDTHSDFVHNALQQHMFVVGARWLTHTRNFGISHKCSSSPTHHPHVSDSSVPCTDPTTSFLSIKLDVPRFSGFDPTYWLFRIMAFFDYHSTSEESHLQIDSFHLDSHAST